MRKTKEVVIDAEGRDKGKRFLITEMSAAQGEAWAWRAFSAVARAGVDIPPEVMRMGMAGIVVVGFNKVFAADWDSAKPLLDEMMACVQARMAIDRVLIDDDIEEIETRLALRSEVFELHTGFSVAAFLSEAWRAARTPGSEGSPEGSPSTRTSPDTSASSSPPA